MAHVTISTTVTREQTTIGGTPVSSTSIGFEFFEDDGSDVEIYIDGTLKTIVTHYTITPTAGTTGGFVGGTINWVVAQSSIVVTAILAIPFSRSSDFPTTGGFNITTLNTQLDKLWSSLKQVDEEIKRKVGLSATDETGAAITLATPIAEAFIKWDAAGTALTSSLTAAGQSLGANGTASLPYYSFTADPNTGMYRVGADNIGLSVGGSKVVDVTSSGINSTVIGATTAAAGTFSSITSGGAVLSDTDSTDSLGSTGVRWLKLWVDSITSGGDIAGATGTFSGEVTGAGFTGTLDGILGGGAPAAAAVTTLTTSGIASIDDTTDTSSGTTGSIHTDGGLGVAKSLHVGTTAKIVGIATHGGDVVSDTDSTDSLGTTGVRWLKLWVDSIQTTANLDVAGDLVVTGNLTINGTTVTNDATNTEIKDPLIELNSGAGSNANDLGILMERGSTGDNVFMGWDESGDYFGFGTTTATADSTGNITYSLAQARFAGLNLSGTSADLGAVTTIDINGGTVDGAVIGGASAAAITGTTLTANTSITLATGGAMTGVLDSDAMSGTSAALLSTSESIKAYVDNNVPENGVKFAWESTTTDTDQGAGKVWGNNGTHSSITVLYIDDVEAGSVSVNAWVDTFDDVSNAAARGYIYIASYGTTNAILVYKVTGAVTSASTYSKIAVTHVLTVGTISDGDSIGLTFVPSGADGEGSGTVTQINAGAGFSFSAITSTGTIAVDGVLQDLDSLGTVSSNSEMIVGTGAGAYAYESGSTLRTSIGVTIGTDVLAQGHTPLGQHTIWIPASAMEAAVTTAAATSNAVEIGTSLFAARTMDFATGADDFCYFGIQMPKSWNAGTLVCQFVWSATGTTANTVLWAIAATSLGNDEVLTTAFSTPTSPAADTNSTTADDLMVSAEVTVTVGSTPTAEDYVIFEVSRDVSGDTLAEDARLHGIKIHYTTDIGSDT